MGKLFYDSCCMLAILLIVEFLLFHQVSAMACIEEEREALLKLKASFVDPSNRLSSWKGIDCCSWDGVGCNEINGHVVKLDLRNELNSWDDEVSSIRLYSNGIDSSLLKLKYLSHLDLSGNYFNYTHIPNFLTSMQELQYLKLAHAHFYGRIPHSPLNSSFLPRLQHLDLSHNSFDCPIPDAFQNMTSLRFLDLSFNRFNSVTPLWLSNMKNLIILNLDYNMFSRFEGGLSSMVRNNCHLKKFYLSSNFVLGGDALGSHENSFTDCNEYDLEVLEMENNKMKTCIPEWLGQLKNLKILRLSDNSLYGPIPTSLGNLSSIQLLNLSYNLLSGGIPSSFGKLVTLSVLDLGSNKLDGVISESFGQLQMLEVAILSDNSLKGVVSEIHFANLSQLKELWVSGNGLLSFDMKHDWIPPFQLMTFVASSIKGFGKEFPRWLETQKEIEDLSLLNANILGPIPTWLRLPNLDYLDLSKNQITGSLAKNISNQMPNLIRLSIASARINGSLPRSICKLKSLLVLELSGNNMIGTIPSCILSSRLTLLDLSSNKFSGIFPNSLQNLSQLEVMSLANNRIEGELPVVLKTCTSLTVLDVEGNRFSGNIPTWLGESLQHLKILNLRNNMLNGTIPPSLWLLPYMQILILADNRLVGNIPPNLRNFSAMHERLPINDQIICYSTHMVCYVNFVRQVIKSRDVNYPYSHLYSMVNIDLSNNSLVGHIPSKILAVNDLFGLNLSHNNLSGTIPFDIGEEKSLESLDLSFNQFSGPIPDSFSDLNSLGVLNLGNNNLSGRIPRKGHLSTFNDALSFDGNPYLCGEPLPMKCPNEESFEPPTAIGNFDNHTINGQGWDKWEKMWLYINVMTGYATGFWVVVGILIFKRQWRYAYFQFMEETKDKIHVAILLYMEKLKRLKRGNNNITQ